MNRPNGRPNSPWWRGAVGYEVYIRSFADASGDGIGDLDGITSRLEYLAWLGIDAVWITPFYPSPGFDHGYDVSNYTDIDPIHGSLGDFDRLVDRAHSLGLKVVVDIVPNHSSSHHRWFLEAAKGPENAYRDFYIWRDPAPGGGPPNNWVSHFGGPAWTFDQRSGQYYCHLFLPEQPDLNWDNERVRGYFDDILLFWMDRGADGFRIDVAQGLIKSTDFADNPEVRPLRDGMTNWEVWHSFDHVHDIDQDLNIEVFRRWNRVVEPYGAMLLAEIGGLSDPERIARYTRGGGAFHSGFFLEPPRMDWEPARLIEMTRRMHDAEPDGISWVIDNHDRTRSATRFGGGQRGARRSLALMTLYLSLGGSPYLYQGQELGIGDGIVEPENLADPIAVRNANSPGRDGTRTAMPWDSGPSNGFTAGEPWLRSGDRPANETVAGQRDDPSSPLHRHRELLAARRRYPDLWEAPAEWHATGRDDIALVERGRVCIAANLSPRPTTAELPEGDWTVAFSSSEKPTITDSGHVEIPAETTSILVRL